MTPDIFIPLGTGSKHDNLELRYALRSIEKYGYNYGSVVVFGEDPKFLNLENPRLKYIKYSDSSTEHKESRIASKTASFFSRPDSPEAAAQWNDDYTLLEPTDISELKAYSDGPLRCKLDRDMQRPVPTLYTVSLQLTMSFLNKNNIKSPHHFDVHMPTIFQRDTFLAQRTAWEYSKRQAPGITVRSTYHNLAGSEPTALIDCKIKGEANITRMHGRWIVSYGDAAIDRPDSPLLREFESRFPDKSSFER